MHRVTYAPGNKAGATRWSLVYFGQSHNRSLMKRMEGSDVISRLDEGILEEDMTAEDWLYVRSTSYKHKNIKEFERIVGKEEPVPVVE